MERKKKTGIFKKLTSVWLLVLITVMCIGLAATNIQQKLDYRFYDTMLGLSKEPETVPDIMLVDIGDTALNEYGSWPWSRDIIADVLLRLKEAGAKTAVFDIEYLTASSLGVDEDINTVTADAFSDGEAAISSAVTSFARAVGSGEVHPSEAVGASDALISNTVDPVLFSMYQDISNGLNRDYDDYFARTVQFFGNTSMTINMRDIKIDVSPEDEAYADSRFLFGNVSDPKGLIEEGNSYSLKEEKSTEGKDFVPAYNKIISRAAGAGFTNVIVDRDGTRRRVELLNSHGNGRYTGQLAFAPLVRLMDVQSMERKARSLVLRGALIPGQTERQDITIPLDPHGRMLINWLPTRYEESFKHFGVEYIKYLDDQEEAVYRCLVELAQADLSELDEDTASFIQNAEYLVQSYEEILEMKEYLLSLCQGFDINGIAIDGGISESDYSDYFALRDEYFENAEAFAVSLHDMGISDEALAETIDSLWDNATTYRENDSIVKQYAGNSFAIIGNSATASTDLGVTPFWRRYANLGTHANVANTILQKAFIRYVDVWWGIAFAFVFCLIVILLTEGKTPGKKSVFGLLYLLVPTGVLFLLMVLFHIYIPLTVPLVLSAITYIVELANSFITSEREKNTLRRGFSSYVSPEVVSEIVKNPQLLGLGGVNKRITALFSDVRTFSGFTECINREEGEEHGAVRLVEILNGYLGALSDAIMAQKGTIDKYVGDEIVSFFGAPIDNPNNAFDSCIAAIRMKQVEEQFNREHESELPIHPITKTPYLLKSRVGLNTGDMVVGNMGTEQKLNYTVMGNNVNLASRLEGTNKAYDSWIIASESTWNEANSGENEGKLVAKMLDCVKVINVEKPVQIYSIQGLKSELTSAQIEGSALFNKGMEWYLKGRETPEGKKDLEDFIKAKHYFEEAWNCYHTVEEQDKSFITTEKKMIARCDAFLKDGLPKDANGVVLPWDGVYTMKSK
ncbi:MAG: adenylate/guanylate cyclase domain-containing protein [Treponema sp.]|nr:adenylate/guanylate cyclase domain-containing protein [Treponema sp.]